MFKVRQMMIFTFTLELLKLLRIKFPYVRDFCFRQVVHFLTDSVNKNQGKKCILGDLKSGKTTLLQIIRFIVEYHNCNALLVTYLNKHANELQIETIHSAFAVNYLNNHKIGFIRKGLNAHSNFLLIDDALLINNGLMRNLISLLPNAHIILTGTKCIDINNISSSSGSGSKNADNDRIKDGENKETQESKYNLGLYINPFPLWLQTFVVLDIEDLVSDLASSFNRINQEQQHQNYFEQAKKLLKQQRERSHISGISSNCSSICSKSNSNGSKAELEKIIVNGTILTFNLNRVMFLNKLGHNLYAKRLQSQQRDQPNGKVEIEHCLTWLYKNKIQKYGNVRNIDRFIYNGEPIRITQATSALRAGTVGIYVHPHKIRLSNNIILPISRVTIRGLLHTKAYPICLNYAETIYQNVGTTFNQTQIDMNSPSIDVYSLSVALSRIKPSIAANMKILYL